MNRRVLFILPPARPLANPAPDALRSGHLEQRCWRAAPEPRGVRPSARPGGRRRAKGALNFFRPPPCATVKENWQAELAATRALGRCFAMTVHPGLIGWGEGLGLLEETLAAMRQGDPVWTPTGLACARWWATRYPAATTLRLGPSIWQDHPGSLS